MSETERTMIVIPVSFVNNLSYVADTWFITLSCGAHISTEAVAANVECVSTYKPKEGIIDCKGAHVSGACKSLDLTCPVRYIFAE